MASNEQIRIDLEAKDNASDTIADVADEAAKLEKLSPEIEVTADTAAASSDLAAVGDDAAALSAADHEIVLKAKVDAARADLQALQGELKQTGERAEDTARDLDKATGGGGGPSVRGNAIADLTGPLGDASGAASDFAGVFDGLGDISEGVASKLGLSTGAAQKMSSMVAGLGVAVAAGAAAWTYFKNKQEEARQKADELIAKQRELTEVIKSGDKAAAAAKFAEVYKDAFDAASAAGIPFGEVYDVIVGTADASETLTARQKEMTEAFADGADGQERYGGELVKTNAQVVKVGDEMTKARGKFDQTSEAIVTQDGDLADLEGAMGGAQTATREMGDTAVAVKSDVDQLSAGFDAMRGKLDFEQAALTFATNFQEAMATTQSGVGLTQQQILDLKSDYLSVAEEVGLNPVQVRADLKKIEDGDIAEVLFATQQAINSKPPITAKLKLELEKNAFVVTGAGGGKAFSVVPANVVNVTQVLPRGYRENDVIGAAARAAQRSGGLYQRVRR